MCEDMADNQVFWKGGRYMRCGEVDHSFTAYPDGRG
jgi:hypothetical protein